jgi:molybdopterin-guanine dinucleotide biosynthesis protein A
VDPGLPAPPLGLVLAGGRSRRFGREKAMAELDGRPMIAAVADRLMRGCAAVAVNAPPGSGAAAWAAAHGFALAPDREGDPDGPLSGVRAGLAWARGQGGQWLVTAPCDTPFLPQDYVARLASGGAPAVAETAEGGQWLCALWPVAALEPLERWLASGHGKVEAFLDACGAARVRFDDASAFANVNRPEDLPPP